MKIPPSKAFLTFLTLLALVVGLAYILARSQSDLLGCQSFLTRIGEGLTRYAREHEGRYPATLDELAPEYIPTVPVCTRAQSPYLYTLTEKGFKVACPGPHPGLQPGSPYLDSERMARAEASATPRP